LIVAPVAITPSLVLSEIESPSLKSSESVSVAVAPTSIAPTNCPEPVKETVPALTFKSPVNVLFAVNVNVPAAVLVKPPAPEITPDKV
jgi:hypothetical protein